MKKIIKSVLIILMLTLPLVAYGGKRMHKEREYQEAWCNKEGGVMEYVLEDGTRVDCLTDEYAIEFDFADKWAEAIGQSLHYAWMTGRKPGIVIIVEAQSDTKHLEKMGHIALKNDIKIWIIDNQGNPL